MKRRTKYLYFLLALVATGFVVELVARPYPPIILGSP